ncbi:MAG: hypothetical protein ACKPGW_17545, partial [Microcystis panniformis]
TLDSLDSCLEQKPLNHPEVIAESDGLIQEKTKKTTLSEISHLEIQNLQEASIIRFVLRTQTLLVKIEKPIINFNLKTVTPIKSPIEPKIEVEVEQLEMETPKSESVESPVDEQSESNLSQIETPVDEQSEIKFPDLIEQALDNDKKELKQDGQELNSHVEKIQQWKQRRETLKQGIKAIRGAADQILSDSRQVQESLPSQLQEQLQGRQQGLDLIGKMLNRLLESTEIDTDDNSEYSELPHLSQSDLMTLIEAEQLEQSAEKLIKNKSKEVGIQRWQLVTQQRDLAEQYRKNWLHFVERKVLPILDGINEGQQHAETLVSQLLKDNAEQEDKLKHWLKTYSNLQELFSQLLTDIKVYRMPVNIGESMDYLRYEPFDVQPDSTLNNECVKEEIRQGYEYQLEAEKELLVLRPALVVVVKNDQG